MSMSWDEGSTTTTCGYDDINRLHTVTYPGQSQVTFGYDWVGNRTGTGWGTVNAVDQLPSDPNGNSYVYDSLYGNLATRTKNSLNTTFEYDNYNLLKKINWPGTGSPRTDFLSDATGNRVRMITSGTSSQTYRFVYDITAGVPAVLLERQGTGTPKLYVRTPDGRLIACVDADSTPTVDFYYHFDGLGSTKALTGPTGTRTNDVYTYDVWGNVTHTGPTNQPYQFVGQLGYYTNYQDSKLNPESTDANKYVMLQLGVRYYAPEMGRFTQRDPVNDGLSRYAYVHSRPVSATDPHGLRDWDWMDFVWHYYFGRGAAVNLANVGLLDNFQNAWSVRRAVSTFEAHLAERAKREAKSVCSLSVNKGKKSVSTSFTENSRASTDVTDEPGLYCVGRSILRQIAGCAVLADCCNNTYRFVCANDYSVHDRFQDPLNLHREVGGTIYDIDAQWSSSSRGGGGF